MARGRRAVPAAASTNRNSQPARRGASRGDEVPDIVQEMLAEVRSSEGAQPRLPSGERPLKRPRAGEGRSQQFAGRISKGQQTTGQAAEKDDVQDESDSDVAFEDVPLPVPVIQTVLDDSDDDDSEDEGLFEDVDLGNLLSSTGPEHEEETQNLELNLSAHQAAARPRVSAERRKPITNAERLRRLEIHKVHLLCLMAHVARRNNWCNDIAVQDALLPLVPEKTIAFLNPSSKLSQFGQTESLKRGIEQVRKMFSIKFQITERSMHRALWAEREEHLKDYKHADDLDSCFDRSEFRKASRLLRGSRDTGAQLFCALLRASGVETRLVCSLQALSCVPGGPTMAKPREAKKSSKPSRADLYRTALARYETKDEAKQEADGAIPSPRRRLGHPHAAAYRIPEPAPPQAERGSMDSSSPKTQRLIRDESPFPVYWVEVFDEAHQKWQPVDPLVTQTQWKPRALEPPASDRQNSLTYAVAFEADGSARDVTRRYAKAYNSKTRRMRVDGVSIQSSIAAAGAGRAPRGDKASSGERWWRRVLRHYGRLQSTDVDQIEDAELAAAEAREPMPRNVADFKDHPVYALQRHLRRHEVLAPDATTAGTVGTGSTGPLERIYRRRDVRLARSQEKWYRLGREIRLGQQPAKVLPKKATRASLLDADAGDDGSNDDDELPQEGDASTDLFADRAVLAGGTPLYTFEQTELYIPPPVVNGRVPRNKFGNLDVYVPSMVPRGGAHVAHPRAAEAAFLLGVDYAPALTGFDFSRATGRGRRRGTAVLTGVVVAQEHEEALWAVVRGLEDLDAEREEERRVAALLRLWGRLLRGLRIRERIWAGAEDDAEEEQEEEHGEDGKNEAMGGENAGAGTAASNRRKAKGKRVVVESEDEEMDDGVSEATVEFDMDDGGNLGGGFLID